MQGRFSVKTPQQLLVRPSCIGQSVELSLKLLGCILPDTGSLSQHRRDRNNTALDLLNKYRKLLKGNKVPLHLRIQVVRATYLGSLLYAAEVQPWSEANVGRFDSTILSPCQNMPLACIATLMLPLDGNMLFYQ
eukprot:8580484-Heterocapsa_arctica.AAC.1